MALCIWNQALSKEVVESVLVHEHQLAPLNEQAVVSVKDPVSEK